MQEYLTYYEKENKAGKKYYYQKVEEGVEGDYGYKILWSGNVSRDDWEWALTISKEQPTRCIMNTSSIICLKN